MFLVQIQNSRGSSEYVCADDVELKSAVGMFSSDDGPRVLVVKQINAFIPYLDSDSKSEVNDDERN